MNGERRDEWTWGSRDPRGRSRRYKRLVNRVLVLGVFIICLVILGAAVLGGKRLLETRSGGETVTTAAEGLVTVDIPSGLGAIQVGKLLEEAGAIESSAAFVDLVKARGSEDKLKPGIYSLARGEQLIVVVEKLEEGAGLPGKRLTIPEGLAVSQTAALLDKGKILSGREYIAAAGRPDKFTVPRIGGTVPEIDSLEGMLFPSTYYLVSGDDVDDLITAQLAAFADKTKALPWKNAQTLGVTAYEVVIIASLIEKEAKIADERSKVAAVIYNRLKKGMTLGIDATVRYAVDKWTGDLTTKDLEVDSPYNTRVKKGLPPAPIASPGVAALQAALEPAKVDYLYYVLVDASGKHFFTSSYEEFLKAKQKASQP